MLGSSCSSEASDYLKANLWLYEIVSFMTLKLGHI